MNLKKILALLLAAVMVCGMLALVRVFTRMVSLEVPEA